MIFNVIYAKRKKHVEYIDFIAYQDDAIIQRPLRYYRRRGQPHPQPKGDLSSGKQAPRKRYSSR